MERVEKWRAEFRGENSNLMLTAHSPHILPYSTLAVYFPLHSRRLAVTVAIGLGIHRHD